MYRYVKPLSYSGCNGSMEYRKVVEVKDIDANNCIKNDIHYSYINEPQGYTFNTASNTWNIASNYSSSNLSVYNYFTQITDGRGSITKYTYDGNGKTVNIEKSGNDHKVVITTAYDANKLPQKISTVTYNVINGVSGNSVTNIEDYVYDQKGNLLQYTGPEATRDTNGNLTGNTYTTPENTTINEHTVVYTYDPNFSMPTSKTWKQDSSTVSRNEYSINSTNGNVEQVREIHSENNIITDYLYDNLGNITKKSTHYADNSGNTYTTYYVYGSEEDNIDRGGSASKYNGLYYGGAYLTREYKILDGTQISKKYVYDFENGNKISDYDENNNKTEYIYDDFNRITLITYADQSTKEYTYNDLHYYIDYYGSGIWNRKILYKDQNYNYFEYIYDIFGNLVQYNSYNWDNQIWNILTQLNYDQNGNKTKEMDVYGRSYQFIYDSADRLIERSFWSSDTTKSKSIGINYTIGVNANTPLLIKITDEDGYIKKYYYDILNRINRLETTPDKINFYETIYSYDYVGHKTSEADDYGHTASYSYDDLGRLCTDKDARNHKTEYLYDAGGNRKQVINQRLKSTYYEYDLLGRMIRTKEPAVDGTTAITRYVYDAAGNNIKVIKPNYYDATKDTANLVCSMIGMSYSYNNMNRLQYVYTPEGVLVEAREYDGNGNISKAVDGIRYNGDITTSKGTSYMYDEFNRKLKETDAMNNVQEYTYYLTDQIKTYKDKNNHTTEYFYFPDGALERVLYPDNGDVYYTYDNRGYKKSEKDQRGNVTYYSYNGFGKIESIKDPYLNTIVYNYYNNGNLYSLKDKRGHNIYYTYFDDNDLQQIKTSIDATNYYIENYVTDECGNTTQKVSTGTLDSASSRTTSYSYYDNNLLCTSFDTSLCGSYITNYYDKNKNLTKVETKRNAADFNIVKFEYDNRDRKTANIRLIDQSDIYNASTLPNISNLQDTNYAGKIQMITGYTYDILNNLTATIDPRAYEYLATDEYNRSLYIIYYGYDELNRLATTTKKINNTNVFVNYYYDAVGNKKAVRNERGYYSVYTYDNMNRLLTETDSETDASLINYTEDQIITMAGQQSNTLIKSMSYGYDLAGNMVNKIDANGYKTEYSFDLLNRLETTKAPYDPSELDSINNPYNQIVEKRLYDENGNIIKRIDAKGYLSGTEDNTRYGIEYSYDYSNRLLTVLDPEADSKGLVFTTKYEYNQYGEKIKETDALNNHTDYEYNSAGKLVKVLDSLDIATNYEYDRAGNMLKMINGKQKVTNYDYNALGLLRSVTDADYKTETYKYDLAGNLAYKLDRNTNETLMTYDLRNMLLSKSVPLTGDTISYTYDNAGNRSTMSDVSGLSSYIYNANNRLLKVVEGGITKIEYTYYKSGNVHTVTDSKGFTTTYDYDTANRMSHVSYLINGITNTTQYSYDINGNRQTISYPNGIAESFQYDKYNRLKTLINTLPNGTCVNYEYTYYDNGLQHTKTDSYGTTTYLYDGDGRIEQISAPGKTTIYSYDNAGNRQTSDETYTSEQFSGHIDQVSGNDIKFTQRHIDYIYSNTNTLLKLIEDMKNTSETTVLKRIIRYHYDDNGNQLSQVTEYLSPYNATISENISMTVYSSSSTTFDSVIDFTNYSYDGFNRLVQVNSINSGKRVISQFTYNGDDLRVKKIVKNSSNNYLPQEINYLYNGKNVILETDSSNNLKVIYIWGINYLGRVDASNNLSYFLYNGHGDVIQTVSQTGIIENQYDYDIWGNCTLTIENIQTNSYTCSIRYSGYYFDNDTGLYYLNARFYDSSIARFLSEDTYIGDINDPLSLNLYTYCLNNPIMYIDLDGHRALKRGSKGDDVKELQKKLGVEADGIFGKDTEKALKDYQNKNGLKPDGVAGDLTKADMGLPTDKKSVSTKKSATSTSTGGNTSSLTSITPKEKKDIKKDSTLYEDDKSEITIEYATTADSSVVNIQTIDVIKQALSDAGEDSATITSTLRTPEQQASAMYTNIINNGYQTQVKIYGTQTDAGKVLAVYKQEKSKGMTKLEIIKAMTDKIDEVGGREVSHHVVSVDEYNKLNVIDIGASSIDNDDKFDKELKSLKEKGIISYYIKENGCFHIEVAIKLLE